MGTSSPNTPTHSSPLVISGSSVRSPMTTANDRIYPRVSSPIPTTCTNSKTVSTAPKSFSIESILSEKKTSPKEPTDIVYRDHLLHHHEGKEEFARTGHFARVSALCQPPVAVPFGSPYGTHPWYSSPWINSRSFFPYTGKNFSSLSNFCGKENITLTIYPLKKNSKKKKTATMERENK